MPRFFSEVSDENNIIITGDDARHIGRSLRMRPEEELTVCCHGVDYNCVITSITEDSVFLRLLNKEHCASEPNIEVTLFQAVPKLDKLEHIIQKTIELGVSRIIPVISRRCVSRPTDKDFAKKLPRLNKIAVEAAKQSGRGIIPQVMPIISYKDAVREMAKLDRSVILYEEQGGISFGDVDFNGAKTVGLLIGSEGGFDPEEAELAANAGAYRVWLGKRILRCETAPVTAMSILMFLTNNM